MNKEDERALIALFMKPGPQEVLRVSCERGGMIFESDGAVRFTVDDKPLHRAYSSAVAQDGRKIHTKHAELKERRSLDTEEGVSVTSVFAEDGLILEQVMTAGADGTFTAVIELRSADGKPVATNHLEPLIFPYPDGQSDPLFLSLDQRMLKVPYDNDCWSRYESVAPNCGTVSSDVTAIYDPVTQRGMVIGALDFDIWKNGISWSGTDARSLIAYSGAAGTWTHDKREHQAVEDTAVRSAAFLFYMSEDVRDGLEEYGRMIGARERGRKREFPVPFGWNSYSALGLSITTDHWKQAGEVLEAIPEFRDEEGAAYINLDGAVGLDHEVIREEIQSLHRRGLKAGWYANPCNWFPAASMIPASGTDVTMGDLFLRDERGDVIEAVDGTVPLDVTHPKWQQYAEYTIRELTDLGIDYIKLDFLAHASLEGSHYRKNYTGRMALNLAYRILSGAIASAGRPIFVSLSIAPLFPCFFGNSRRAGCDTFGHLDDSRYACNALQYAWWTNGSLYDYNDPDHIPLAACTIDGRGSITEEEARMRYLTSVISGTVMLLSDDYSQPQAVERTKKIASNAELNELARLGRAFRPVSLTGEESQIFTLKAEGRSYAAFFHWGRSEATLTLDARKEGLGSPGRIRLIADSKDTGERFEVDGDTVAVHMMPASAVLAELLSEA